MHTSTVIASPDFEYWEIDQGGTHQVDFETFCPSYHEQDRTAVISPILEDGVLNTGYALLAMTTVFYDIQRSKPGEFFIYPQHFAIMDMDEGRVVTHDGRLPMDPKTTGRPWTNLDVWPESKWYGAQGTASGMLQKILDLQINRVFWPEQFGPKDCEVQLSDYAKPMLKSTLKEVYYYQSATPNFEIRVNEKVMGVFQTTVDLAANLASDPKDPLSPASLDMSSVGKYRKTLPDEFLLRMEGCFPET
jgi:hypothetical protein